MELGAAVERGSPEITQAPSGVQDAQAWVTSSPVTWLRQGSGGLQHGRHCLLRQVYSILFNMDGRF